MVWKRLRAAGASVLVAGLLAGCAGDGGTGGQAADGPLKVVGPFEVHSIDPATSGGFFTRLQVAETLVEASTDGALQPGLATGWETSEDRLTWRFTIRPDALFHDGTAVTAEAVKAALETARSKESPLADVPVKAVTADGGTVTVELTKPFAPLAAVLAHTSTQILAPASYGPDRAVTEVIGSGPYRVERLQQPSGIELTAFEQWQGEKPVIREVTYQAVGRAESRALMAESGQADVTFGMDPVSLQRLQQNEGVEIEAVTLPRSILLKANAGHEILGDLHVRQALSTALDRKSMAEALLRDPEMAATQLFPPSLQDWHQESLDPLAHDAEAAKALLAEAGWTPGADGVLVRDGRRFEVSLRTFPDRPELPVLATAVQAALREVGIVVDVRIGNSSEIPAAHQDGTLELALFTRNFALVPDPLVTLAGDFAPEGSDWGAMGWNNPELTAALNDLARGADGQAAEDGRETAARILHTELPVIPVAWYRQSAIVNDRVEGLELDPLERSWRISELSWAQK
ncbi:ABC transporter substrate-binding protein [Arthrobacter mobilis]|uniref:ABC transporter substrate-binding protein n=1 Tax=Arthrobacter mobilis TaxID=2724944 RepID=A0A7X6HC79_9MICC|nr:ABC transporter substrate-binding protein [Arthrobacter mobilis]NKX54432.1 ABC transporter substrate-binding protein [Arthrobacter mobilis]